MLSHYLISLRTLRRAPFLTLTKLLVLAVGLCCFVVAYALVSYWRHAERGFAKSDLTYAMTTRIQLSDSSDTTSPRLDNQFYEKLKIAFPELEALARAHGGGPVPLSAGDRKVRMFGSYADDQFLAVFDLPFVAGDARHALNQPNSAVLTQDAARRVFGTANALGWRAARVQPASVLRHE